MDMKIVPPVSYPLTPLERDPEDSNESWNFEEQMIPFPNNCRWIFLDLLKHWIPFPRIGYGQDLAVHLNRPLRLYKPQKRKPKPKGPILLATLMADRAGKAVGKVNKEGSDGDSDDNIPISAINKGKKKVEDSDDDEVPLAVSRAKKKSAESKKIGWKGNSIPSQVKKKEEDSKEGLQKKKGENKKENSKGKEKQNKKSSSDKVKRERVKKVYDLPGQKHDPPEERDPLRIFYESLYNQVPDSEMAAIWMMEWGLLPENEAKKVFEKKKKGISSPAKPLSARKSPAANGPVKRSLSITKNTKDNSTKSKKRKAGSDSEDSSDDLLATLKLNPKKKQRVSN